MFDRYLNTIRKMSPGSLGGQSRVATPPARYLYINVGGSVSSSGPEPGPPPEPGCNPTIITIPWVSDEGNENYGTISPPGTELFIVDDTPPYEFVSGFLNNETYLVTIEPEYEGSGLSAWMGGGDNDYYATGNPGVWINPVHLSIVVDEEPRSGNLIIERLNECLCPQDIMEVLYVYSGYSDSQFTTASERRDPLDYFSGTYLSGPGGFSQIDVSHIAGDLNLSWFTSRATQGVLEYIPVRIEFNGSASNLYLTEPTRNIPVNLTDSTVMAVRLELQEAEADYGDGNIILCPTYLD